MYDIISGGNFHGEPIALVMAYFTAAMSELGAISERRQNRLVNPALSGLPAFLTKDSGLNSGLMIAQYTAAALASENKVYSHPAAVDSIPTSADQEDHVSMGTTQSRMSLKVVENVETIISIELLMALQGLSFGCESLSPVMEEVLGILQMAVPPIDRDRVFHNDIEAVRKVVRSGALAAAVEKQIGKMI
jgi:histidine ammonia-lyase